MTENPRDSKPQAPRRPRLRLPFDNRREDAGTWAYDHRIGLCVTLIAYLALMIVFVSSKIVVGARSHQQGMYVDLQSLAELPEVGLEDPQEGTETLTALAERAEAAEA